MNSKDNQWLVPDELDAQKAAFLPAVWYLAYEATDADVLFLTRGE